ncbi:unnamed protein product [Fraxinus pennsylvanica]|uniref:Uncharacterized protein n=1 Tax=Fraxinus pennsylvanica TaxID=56036 RepID=A0AAD1ZYR6_9LAMI|nr:unnamed protein product [Fraxinus pennsylvanica]
MIWTCEKLQQSGFKGVSLGGNDASQATLLLGMFYSDGYTLVEDNGALKRRWKDLCLLTASAWRPCSSPSTRIAIAFIVMFMMLVWLINLALLSSDVGCVVNGMQRKIMSIRPDEVFIIILVIILYVPSEFDANNR